jgi:3',5'-cyclic AMP phosphodiesterase CpdA
VSDLHFGGGSVSHQYNREEVLKALLEDVRADVKDRKVRQPDLIFVTGDIAFKADPQEYQDASSWLSQLAKAVGASTANLRLVPGNHDVDRKLAGSNAVQYLHRGLRDAAATELRERRPVALLDGSLKDAVSRPLLRQKLEAYVAFVNALAPNHPRGADGVPLDWAEPLVPVAQRPGRLWLVGMCSVWVSDKGDGERRLFLGEQQLRALDGVGKEDLVLMLTHHPPGWLHADCETLLLERLAERAHHIHLCGHVHTATALALRGLGRSKESFRLVAGAGHGDSAHEHAYSWGALRWNEVEESWELGWAPRSFVPGEGWRKDRNRYELDDEGFAWEPLSKLRWGPPKAQEG